MNGLCGNTQALGMLLGCVDTENRTELAEVELAHASRD